MIFKVMRTSDCFSEDRPPCNGAFMKVFPIIDTRTLSEEEFDSKFSIKWRDYGTGHKKLGKNKISRKTGDQTLWAIDIDSIDSLMDFIKKNGGIVLDENSIEIYDTYRE